MAWHHWPNFEGDAAGPCVVPLVGPLGHSGRLEHLLVCWGSLHELRGRRWVAALGWWSNILQCAHVVALLAQLHSGGAAGEAAKALCHLQGICQRREAALQLLRCWGASNAAGSNRHQCQ